MRNKILFLFISILFINYINYYKVLNDSLVKWGWGLGIGDWGLGIGPNPQSPIPNPQSPIPNPHLKIKNVETFKIEN
jgi:hypothetical protein